MRLLYENDTVTDGVRLGRKGDILVAVRDALECVLAAMPAFELCVSSGENELHRDDGRTAGGVIDMTIDRQLNCVDDLIARTGASSVCPLVIVRPTI